MSSPLTVSINGLEISITAAPLGRDAFAPFGEVVENPRPDVHPTGYGKADALPFAAVWANQGSAIKYQHVSRMLNLYADAPSGTPGQAVINMFVCAARRLEEAAAASLPGARREKIFPVSILERHPFTTQTFIPVSRPGADTRYLVIVAPSLPPSPADAALPVPAAPSAAHPVTGSEIALPGRGLPDVRRLRAFVASGAQAVTYGAGTWHAPMVALGGEGEAVDFAVVQFANGVGIEDVQEVVFASSPSSSSSPASSPFPSSGTSTAAAAGSRHYRVEGGGGGRGRIEVRVPDVARIGKL